MTAVHFGAGNIGRGFIGLLLHEAGHHVTFVDVDAELINEINSTPSYRVIETGDGAQTHTVTDFSGLNSAVDPDQVVSAISAADIVTTAVGPRVLPFIAPLIAQALKVRPPGSPLAIMACENALGATDVLKEAIAELADASDLSRAVFANTAVDRIVPVQAEGLGLDVVVESFCEWVVEGAPFGGKPPVIPGAHFVDDLAPFIERKLFTVNTGHASIAYLGRLRGASTIAEALALPEVRETVLRVLDETADMLVARHGIDPDAQREYAAKTVSRFLNPELVDLTDRVGRQPMRKLSRHERLIEPAAALAERGITPTALLEVISAAFQFDVADDAESVELKALVAQLNAEDLCERVCGITPQHPLFPSLVSAISRTL
jgi:mannitol-1-phosphate 5-dehydrogenase